MRVLQPIALLFAALFASDICRRVCRHLGISGWRLTPNAAATVVEVAGFDDFARANIRSFKKGRSAGQPDALRRLAATARIGKTQALFPTNVLGNPLYDVSADRQKCLIADLRERTSTEPVALVHNQWPV
jgi:hypothetical protein